MQLGIRFFAALLFFGGQITISSQGLSHQVIVPVAGLQNGAKVHYSQTLGEAAVEVMACPAFVFTQGFQQPGLKKKSDIPPPGNGVKVYPNPVTDFVTIELFGNCRRTFKIDFFSISGVLLWSEKIEFNDNYWYCRPFDVENYSRGLFLIRIISTDGLINRSFKIEKL